MCQVEALDCYLEVIVVWVLVSVGTKLAKEHGHVPCLSLVCPDGEGLQY